MRRRDILILLGAIFLLTHPARATQRDPGAENSRDSSITKPTGIEIPRRLVHRIGVEAWPTYVVPMNYATFDDGRVREPGQNSFSAHLHYSFRYHPKTLADRIYGGAYQGIGVAWNNFRKRSELGNPYAFYLLQGAHIVKFAPRFSLNYEWNFGLSAPWKPYHPYENPQNRVIGSTVNAYISANFYFNYSLGQRFDILAGVALTHFSNGNTKLPNGGLNTIGAKLGLVYNFNNDKDIYRGLEYASPVPRFPRHVSYDLIFFGSWRRRVVVDNNEPIMLPDAYTVLGFSFSPMYNFGYRLRAGIALDGCYGSSANRYYVDNWDEYYSDETRRYRGETDFPKPPLNRQLALGLSARAEFVMPYFTIGLGLGANFLHGVGDLKACYQILSLKIEVTRNSFVHVGYSLHNFRDPNFLMLGIGFRFNNKYPAYTR